VGPTIMADVVSLVGAAGASLVGMAKLRYMATRADHDDVMEQARLRAGGPRGGGGGSGGGGGGRLHALSRPAGEGGAARGRSVRAGTGGRGVNVRVTRGDRNAGRYARERKVGDEYDDDLEMGFGYGYGDEGRAAAAAASAAASSPAAAAAVAAAAVVPLPRGIPANNGMHASPVAKSPSSWHAPVLDEKGRPTTDVECVICLECITRGGEGTGPQTTALACGHVFHSTCIEQWLASKAECPVCRNPQQQPT
jgi:hypothetical protein